MSLWIVLLIGAAVGFFAGFMGAGGGFILYPAMIYLLGVETRAAVGTSLLFVFAVSGAATVLKAFHCEIDLILTGLLMCGSVFGVPIGAAALNRVGDARHRMFFSILLFLGAAVSAVKLIASFLAAR